jgi:2-keto-3-deoxy-L-rhamnonate aldolase RhmA
MQGQALRECLHAGKPVYGTHVVGLNDMMCLEMLKKANLDFAFICMEHMSVERSTVSVMCHHFAHIGICPIVRVVPPFAVNAARLLDSGAQGIVAPYLETVEEAEALVDAVHLRPLKGKRLQDIRSGRDPLPKKSLAYLEQFNRNNLAIIGIESKAAYENLDALLAVPGVDAVFLGPHDLSVSFDMPEEWDNPEYLRILEDIVIRSRKAGLGVGVHGTSRAFPAAFIQRLIKAGMNWILDSADIIFTIEKLLERQCQWGIVRENVEADKPAAVKTCISAGSVPGSEASPGRPKETSRS